LETLITRFGLASLAVSGVTGGWQNVTFIDRDDTFRTFGGEVTFDTRVDPILPRNAVYATASRERLWFTTGESFDRIRMDARGYLGLIGQTILVVRAVRQDATEPVPLYMKSLLGGWSSLRGFRAGSFIGDTMVTGAPPIACTTASCWNVIPTRLSPVAAARAGASVRGSAARAWLRRGGLDDRGRLPPERRGGPRRGATTRSTLGRADILTIRVGGRACNLGPATGLILHAPSSVASAGGFSLWMPGRHLRTYDGSVVSLVDAKVPVCRSRPSAPRAAAPTPMTMWWSRGRRAVPDRPLPLT
jgi:hypothetical protein